MAGAAAETLICVAETLSENLREGVATAMVLFSLSSYVSAAPRRWKCDVVEGVQTGSRVPEMGAIIGASLSTTNFSARSQIALRRSGEEQFEPERPSMRPRWMERQVRAERGVGNLAPCECMSETHFRDLGQGFDPRFIRDVLCKGKCSNEHGVCVPRNRTVTVLKRLPQTWHLECENGFRPVGLTGGWGKTKVMVTTHCDCVL
ncbi:uncharacterized protein LOC106178113 isoform X2 [Lingula anatina]|uniref:Uncharacterized protein LOC106178113 isoform X2 n=1 Tax=Lingula anatina TaxID=7574 RepID=A0A1S3K273_LINAN|nr:uncharacterized protein LOC106178113 isoform X2 [Lingula anatina]|eukprot:XP_013416617.1 uncharacterized protein LOC106178113 isoform X2 [Lingula anatina]